MRSFVFIAVIFFSLAGFGADSGFVPLTVPQNEFFPASYSEILPKDRQQDYVKYGYDLLKALSQNLSGARPRNYRDSISLDLWWLTRSFQVNSREKALRLTALSYYAGVLKDKGTPVTTLSKWLEREIEASLDTSPLRRKALVVLDFQTKEFGSDASGFGWASEARLDFLALIPKIISEPQLEYFEKALQIAVIGYAPIERVRMNFGRKVNGLNLDDEQSFNYYLTRKVIKNFDTMSATKEGEAFLARSLAMVTKVESHNLAFPEICGHKLDWIAKMFGRKQ